ncbi:alpha-amylase family glycosyl hydrolase [Oceanithermus profundus]
MRKLITFLLVLVLGLALAVKVTFKYTPPPGLEVNSVSLRGSFNNWGETPMQPQPDGSWAVTLDLDPGEYTYKFFINGQWPKDMCDDPTFGRPMVDPTADGCTDDGFGGQNAVRIVEAPVVKKASGPVELAFEHDPAQARYLSVADGRLAVRFSAGAGSVASAELIAGDARYEMYPQLEARGRAFWRVSLPDAPTSYRIHVVQTDGREATFGPFTYGGQAFRGLDWVGERVGYQIFPERFWNGEPGNDELALASDEYNFNARWRRLDPENKPFLSPWNGPVTPQLCCHQYFGGDLTGVIQKLDYLARQGVGLVYLNPVFDSGSAHGYDTHDYLKVSPKFGDKAVLRVLLDGAHARGIKVLFDFVPNHTGLGFWAFRDVVRRGPNSPYWNWYFIKKWPFEPGDASAYEAWWNIGSLPKLNTGNPAVRRYLLEVAKYWIRFGFDGVRVDVPGDLIDAHGFFAEMRRELKKVNPEAYLVAEIWQADASWLQGDEFDSLMNYALGRGAILKYAKGKPAAFASGKRALREMSQVYAVLPEAATDMGFNLIDSHDTSRLLTDLGGGKFGQQPSPEGLARQRLATAILYALPGVPVHFQGDECAFVGEKDPYDKQRYPLQWERCDAEMQAFYRGLATLKETLPAFDTAVWRAYLGEGPLLGFYRGEPGPGEVLALFNNSTEPQTAPLPPGAWQDVQTRRTYRKQVPLEPLGWRYLRHRP